MLPNKIYVLLVCVVWYLREKSLLQKCFVFAQIFDKILIINHSFTRERGRKNNFYGFYTVYTVIKQQL